ncbi:MAG: LuxR C-terminal-related transcriptional regulator [Acidimicrobiales bacterium]|jgi:DNA-binding NarL/FixJ family response regulator
MIRVLLVDDHASAREPLAFMLNHQDDIEVVATAGSVAESQEALAGGLDLDVAVLDLGLPDGWGTELIGTVHASNPRAVTLVLTSYTDQVVLAQALAAGAAGVLNKSADVDEIVAGIRRLHAGEQLVSAREVADAIRVAATERDRGASERRLLDSLTPREREVLQTLAGGLADKEIAAELGVGVGTVRTHVNAVLTKLGVRSRLQAVVLAARNDAIDLS